MVLHAVIFVPPTELARWAKVCLDLCAAYGYKVVGIVCSGESDDDQRESWDRVVDMLIRGVAQVAVVARREHLPPDRLPRVIVAAEVGQPPGVPATRRRARRLGPVVLELRHVVRRW